MQTKSKAANPSKDLKGVSNEELKEVFVTLVRQFEMTLPNIQRALNIDDEEWIYLKRIAEKNEIPSEAALVRSALRFLGLLPNNGYINEDEQLVIARSPDDIISELVAMRDA